MAVFLGTEFIAVGPVRPMARTQATARESLDSSPSWTNRVGHVPSEMWTEPTTSPPANFAGRLPEPVSITWMRDPILQPHLTALAISISTSARRNQEGVEPSSIRRINTATFVLAGAALVGLLLILFAVHLLDDFASPKVVDWVVLSGAAIVSLAAVAWILVAGLMIIIMVSPLFRGLTTWTWRRKRQIIRR